MRMNVIRTESLHAEIVNETIILNKLNLLPYLLVRNCTTDKSKRYTKTISLKIAKLDWFEASLERANFDFGVPVLAPLLPD